MEEEELLAESGGCACFLVSRLEVAPDGGDGEVEVEDAVVLFLWAVFFTALVFCRVDLSGLSGFSCGSFLLQNGSLP